MPVLVRPATPDDAPAVAAAHVAAWRATYAGVMPAAYLAELSVERWTAGWARRLDGTPDDHHVVVGLLDDDVVGFAGFGPARDDDSPAGTGELYAINLCPDAWGRGVGSALVAAVDAGLAGLGHRAALLWVVPSNARARRFYERHGWTDDVVERTAEVNGVVVPERRYRRTLP